MGGRAERTGATLIVAGAALAFLGGLTLPTRDRILLIGQRAAEAAD